jgi:HlyD family secretion protein
VAIGKNGAVVRQLRALFDMGTIRELTDGQLLERFATGGGEAAELAFAALVERHGPMVLRVCRGVLADAHDSQDAFQATFLVLVRKARGLWVRDSLGPWLHQVAYRTALCARLAAARRHRHERCGAALRKEARFDVHDSDLERALHEEIERLPERYRAPLVLCDIEGRSHEQAARHLGWPVGTVKSRQARGRDRLRDRLIRRGVAPHGAVLTAALRPDQASTLLSPALVDSTMKTAIRFVSCRTIVPGTASTLAQGVLSSMHLTHWLKVVSAVLVVAATTSGVGLLAQRGRRGAERGPGEQVQGARADDAPATAVKPGKLRVTVSERGSLEALRYEHAYCLVEGRTTIVQLLPEGTPVKKGQIVCELDSAALRDQLTNQQITVKSAEASYRNAKLTREVAEIAVVEYREGIYRQDLAVLTDAVTAAETAIQKADARMKRTQLARQRLRDTLASKRATSTPADIVAELDIEDRLESAELTLLRERMLLEQARSKQGLLEKITFPKMMRELKDEVERARSAELAKKATWDLEIAKARKLEKQVLNCTIKASSDGTLVLANDPSRLPGRPTIIEEGVAVRERQRILSVVDLNGPMLVNTKVHESQVDKLAQNMKAKIHVDAFASETLDGTVIEISPLPDSTNFFSSDIKVYTTRVKIDQPLPGLKPGMTARVEILVSELDNVLSVPVEAIVRYDDKDHVAVKKSDGGIDWREVTLGLSNGKFVEIKQGINSGDVVIGKPLDFLSEHQKREMRLVPTQPAAKPEAPRNQ